MLTTDCCKTTEEDEKREAAVSVVSAKRINMHAAVAAVLSRVDGMGR